MTDVFTDTNGATLAGVPVSVDEGQSATYTAKVPARAGRVLKAAPDAGITVEARRTGSGAAFVNLATNPVDLTPFDGQQVAFDFRVSAGAVSALAPLQAVVMVAYA